MQTNPDLDPNQHKRLVIAVVLSTLIMGLWYYYYQMPIQKAQEEARAKAAIEQTLRLEEQAKQVDVSGIATIPTEPQKPAEPTREELISKSPRVKIDNGRLHGSIRLIGARLDDITLAKYKETLEKNSPEVALMTPTGSATANFIDIGWISADPAIKAPDSNSLWKVEKGDVLTKNTPVTLSWENGQGQKFILEYKIDENYMFVVSQRIENSAATPVTFHPYGLISKAEKFDEENFILHTGPMGVLDGTLTEVSYDDLRDNPNQTFEKATGWLGLTDKYWFKSLIPQNGETYTANFRQSLNNNIERFQIDYLGEAKTVAAGGSSSYTTKLFAGAKELKLLANYSKQLNIPLFERAIDFGWFYFITKPMYYLLINFHSWVGNFGIAIILLTFCVKFVLFPLARKSYISMGRLKHLHPKIIDLQKRYKDDKISMQRELMALYKKEKVNPAAGCLPILLQIPIFFSLYKVFFISIEMRHAPFFGWIKDLSVKDPTSFINLFGLLPFDPPSFLIIGVFPCIMAITMYIQQLLTPAPTDQMAAKMMKAMPVIFLFMFASFPSGLVIYWCFSNLFTIMQQAYFLKYHNLKR